MGRFPFWKSSGEQPIKKRGVKPRSAKQVSKMSPGASRPRTPKRSQKVSGTVRDPVLPFLGCSVLTENLQIYQGFSFAAEHRRTLEKHGKDPFQQGNSLLKINQGNPNNQGKEGQGMVASPLAATVVTAIVRFDFCAAKVLVLTQATQRCRFLALKRGFAITRTLKTPHLLK